MLAVLVGVAILFGVGLLLQGGQVAGVSSEEPIVIGVSTILSGDWAGLGENVVRSAQLAVDDINARGGINGRPVVLSVQDAGVDSKTGLSAAQKLVAEGVQYIIGATASNGTMAAAPLVNESHVLYLTPVTGGSNIDATGEYVFRMANGDTLAGRDLARAATKLGFRRVAVVTEVTEYSLDIQKSFVEAYTGTIVINEMFQPGTKDFRTVVAKVAAEKPDAFAVLSQTGIAGAYFVSQARTAGVTAPVFSDFTFITNTAARDIIGSFDGVYYADPSYGADSTAYTDVATAFNAKYGSAPLIPFHTASTYDSVQLIAQAISEVGDDSTKVHDWLLTNVKNRTGLMGTYSLDAEGNSDLGFVVKRVVGEGFEVVH